MDNTLGEKIKDDNDYIAVADKICNLLTETTCEFDPCSNKKGFDALVYYNFFNEEAFSKMCKAFKNIDSDYYNAIVEYEADKAREQYKCTGRYKMAEELYKLQLKAERKEEEQDEEINLAEA